MSRPPIENGCVQVENGRIVSVERCQAHAEATDLGDAVVVPGFVNAHTHLELTGCAGRVPYRGSFPQWIADLTAINPHRSADAGVLERALADGWAQSLAAGVTAVGDIGIGPRVLRAWRSAPLHLVGFLEVMGLGERFRRLAAERRSAAAVEQMLADLPANDPAEDAAHTSRKLRRFGVTPHAPYSTDDLVYGPAIVLARARRLPICTHLAETRDELQFLAKGTGPLRRMLEEMDLWDGTFQPPGCSPVEYVHRLGLLDLRPLLAHVNYASDGDLDLLARSQACVAFCPRSHLFFQHEPHRYRDMLARGINVCLGTDSLASNASLSILDELRHLAVTGHLPHPQLLAMGTIAGARALGLDDRIGSLEPGKHADLVAVPLAHPATADPLADVLHSQAPPAIVGP